MPSGLRGKTFEEVAQSILIFGSRDANLDGRSVAEGKAGIVCVSIKDGRILRDSAIHGCHSRSDACQFLWFAEALLGLPVIGIIASADRRRTAPKIVSAQRSFGEQTQCRDRHSFATDGLPTARCGTWRECIVCYIRPDLGRNRTSALCLGVPATSSTSSQSASLAISASILRRAFLARQARTQSNAGTSFANWEC